MKKDKLAKLLSSVLDSQLESGKHGAITSERLREALTSGPPLNKEEQRILLLSPVAREDYVRVKAEVQKKMEKRLEESRVDFELMPLAAASAEDKVVMQGADFNVTLINKEELGIPWVILVQLGNSYTRAINPMTTLRLVDSGGLEWVRGNPDTNGELIGAWEDDETDLLNRAKRFTLLLEPV